MNRHVRALRVVLGLLALACWLAPAQMGAQQGTGNVEVRFEDTEPKDFPTISTRVTVLDPDGLPIAGLDSSSFDVFEDGRQVRVIQVDPVVNPNVRIAVALVIDISGSMYEEIGDAKAAASSFVNGLGANDLVAVLGFRGEQGEVNLDEPFPQINSEREIDFTSDKVQVLALIDRLDVPSLRAGRTPLYDALFKAVRMTARPGGVDYRFVLAFTDGNERCADCAGSILGRRDPIDEAQEQGVPVFTIGLGKDADENYLKQVALTTGGTYQFTPTPDKLVEIYQDVVDRVKQQYVISYKARAAADGQEHKLDVKVTTPRGEGRNVIPIAYPCPEKPGVRLFYLKPPDVLGEEATIEPLEDGQAVQALLTIVPDLNACHPIANVELYLDRQLVFTAEQKPFHLLYDFIDLQRTAPGDHELVVRATDQVGNSSDDVAVTVDVVAITGASTPVPSVSATATLETQVPVLMPQVPRWALGVAGIVAVLALLVAVLLLTRRKPGWTCPNCGRQMESSWRECPFCASQSAAVEGDTEPEQPVVALPEEKKTIPVAAARRAAAAGIAVPGHRSQRFGWLIVEHGGRVGKRYPLQDLETSVGRSGTNDIVLDDPAVSRQQARIRLQPDGYHLYDLAATNPTLVNGQVVSHQRLVSGDHLQIGTVELVFQESSAG